MRSGLDLDHYIFSIHCKVLNSICIYFSFFSWPLISTLISVREHKTKAHHFLCCKKRIALCYQCNYIKTLLVTRLELGHRIKIHCLCVSTFEHALHCSPLWVSESDPTHRIKEITWKCQSVSLLGERKSSRTGAGSNRGHGSCFLSAKNDGFFFLSMKDLHHIEDQKPQHVWNGSYCHRDE